MRVDFSNKGRPDRPPVSWRCAEASPSRSRVVLVQIIAASPAARARSAMSWISASVRSGAILIIIKGVNEYGSGGMQTKIETAKICQLAGFSMVKANGLSLNPISMISKKNICTWFSSKVSKLDARKKWIISSIAPKGSIIIDDGAKKALRSGKSLLAAGIKKISGKFNKGDHVKILDKKNNECARGLSSFTSDEIVKIMGHHSNQIEKLLGYVAKSEVIHKDDMVEI